MLISPSFMRFARARGGSVTILFGLAVTVLALIVGLAIDSARVFNIKACVQVALSQALKLCDAMRSETDPTRHIRIYTVAFQAPSAAEAMLKQCSGEANYYDANDASQLSDAFRDIARCLNNLRVTNYGPQFA